MNLNRNEIKISLAFNNKEGECAVKRYLYFVMGCGQIDIASLKNPYRWREAITLALNSDMIIADGLMDGKPTGFHFAKTLQKNTLLLFYAGEILIEKEGYFWLVLPFSIDKLSEKILEQLNRTAPSPGDFEALESRFEILQEKNSHHK